MSTHEKFKRTLFIRTKTLSANFRSNPLYRATKRQQLNSEKQDEKLNHLSVFGWAMLSYLSKSASVANNDHSRLFDKLRFTPDLHMGLQERGDRSRGYFSYVSAFNMGDQSRNCSYEPLSSRKTEQNKHHEPLCIVLQQFTLGFSLKTTTTKTDVWKSQSLCH